VFFLAFAPENPRQSRLSSRLKRKKKKRKKEKLKIFQRQAP